MSSTTSKNNTEKGKRAPIDLTKLKVILIEPKKRLKGETKSKFLDPESDLFFHIWDCQQRLKQAGVRFESRLDPHVELISNSESLDVFLRRSKELHMMDIDVTDKKLYKVMGKTLVMTLPSLSDKEVCIKIAHFNTLPPHIDRLTTIIFNPDFSPYSEWEQTVFD
jgi:hypothetical protein